jgi:hypothetical protein
MSRVPSNSNKYLRNRVAHYRTISNRYTSASGDHVLVKSSIQSPDRPSPLQVWGVAAGDGGSSEATGSRVLDPLPYQQPLSCSLYQELSSPPEKPHVSPLDYPNPGETQHALGSPRRVGRFHQVLACEPPQCKGLVHTRRENPHLQMLAKIEHPTVQ